MNFSPALFILWNIGKGGNLCPNFKEKGIIYKCVIIVIAVATDFSTCFSARRVVAVARITEAAVAVTITEAVAVVPTMMTTGLTGATVGVVATGSDLHARTAVAVIIAEAVAVATPVTTPVTVAAVAVTLAETTITAAVTDAV